MEHECNGKFSCGAENANTYLFFAIFVAIFLVL